MNGSVVSLFTLSASVGAPAVRGVVAYCKTILAEVLCLDVAQPLCHSQGLPLGTGCLSGLQSEHSHL